jgi:hypothetical protein
MNCIGFWGGKCLCFTVSFTLPQRSLILFRGAKLTLILLRASGFSSIEAGLHFRSKAQPNIFYFCVFFF